MSDQVVAIPWPDGVSTIVAKIISSQQKMLFYHEDAEVANIDQNGNLNIKGELKELNDPKLMSLVHPNDKRWQIWPHPVVYYDSKKMTGLLVPDVNSPLGMNYPACFWDEKDFYVWGKLETNVAGPAGTMLQFSPFELDGLGVYTKTTLRGNVISELDNKVEDEPQAA